MLASRGRECREERGKRQVSVLLGGQRDGARQRRNADEDATSVWKCSAPSLSLGSGGNPLVLLKTTTTLNNNSIHSHGQLPNAIRDDVSRESQQYSEELPPHKYPEHRPHHKTNNTTQRNDLSE